MTSNFAEVYLNLKTSEIYSSFDYLIPENLNQSIKIGSLVLVPFGNRLEAGFVSRIKSSSSFKETSGREVREIKDILFSKTFFDLNRLKLAHWLSFYYMSSMGNALKLFMPPGFKYKYSRYIFFNEIKENDLVEKYPLFSKVNLKKGYYEKDLIRLLLKIESITENKVKNILAKLEKENYATVRYMLVEPKIKSKFIDVFKINKEEIQKTGGLSSIKNVIQKQIIELLKVNPEVEGKEITEKLKATPYSIKALINKNLIIKEKKILKRDFNYDSYINNNDFESDLKLNSYQENCINKITDIIGKNIHHNFLIEGVTGSGKTEVYIRCVKNALKNKKSALILTPEISLTPQLYSNFKKVFKHGLTVYHSGMSENERFEKWLDILEGNLNIIIGTRSAIFTPILDLGIIIVDEEHDSSYKENYGLRYNAIDTVIKLGEILKIPVVFGSATPSIALKYKLNSDSKSTVLSMPEKIFKQNEVDKQIVDLKKIDRTREDEIITDELFNNIKYVTEKNEKVILFINRRGYSNFVICNECGYIPKCDNCNLPYTYHMSEKKLKCHHCGSEKAFTDICFSCKSRRIILYGTGIQKVESKLKQRFPGIPVIRMDSDITSKKKSHEEILNKFISNSPSILLGTQMISKGLDIKDVTLVGVINIDSMLSLPDYHINERVFSLLTQVSGRTGRSSKTGKVIIQTFKPESVIIKNFIEGDYEDFYLKELSDRKELDYPPFSHLINIIVSSRDEKIAKIEINKLYDKLIKIINSDTDFASGKEDQLLGPSPAPFVKLNQFYRWHILIKTSKINKFISRFTKLIRLVKIEKNCRLIIDIDPVWIL
ncbi:primosomal protein N' [bacterium]|nr:primosomal protein N' [bacterium]